MATPTHFDDLCEADKRAYERLRLSLSAPTCKNRRNKSLETFRGVVECIRAFVIGHDDDHWKRALVCGICWFENSIAINTRQFKILTNKCKSSINGLFLALGYGTVPSGSDAAAPLMTYFPFMRGNFNELRQWTVRQRLSATPLPGRPAPFATLEPRYITPPPGEPAELDGFGFSIGGLIAAGDRKAVSSDDDQKAFANVFDDPFALWGEQL
jgi:hypothetical protein